MISAARWIRAHLATLAAIGVGVLAVLASFGPATPVSALGWRAGGGVDSAWRLLSAHFVHLGAAHLAADLSAAVLIGWSCDRLGLAHRLPAAALASLVAVDLGLEFGPWAIGWYAGLSGVLHGLFAWLTLCLVLSPSAEGSRRLRWMAAALFLGGLLKGAVGLGTPVGAPGWLGIPQATPAHLYGYLGGTLWAFLRREK
jgi:rhomboid family GlyGly-CTERM serine protease